MVVVPMKRWPLNKAYLWEKFPFFRLLLPLIVGILLYPKLSLQTEVTITAFLLLCASFIVLAYNTQRKETTKQLSFINLYAALILLGYLLSYFHDVRNDKLWFGHTVESAEAYSVRLIAPPVEKNKTIKLEVDVTGYLNKDSLYPTTGKAFVYIYKYDAPAYKEGDVLFLPNDWQPITNSGNPFAFDYATYTTRNNIHYQSFHSHKDIQIQHYAQPANLSFSRRVHLYCIDQLNKYVYDNDTRALLEAMLMGDKANLDPELRQAYADTGIIHIIAISGAHIAVFFMLVAFLLGWIKHRKYRWVKYIAALPLIWVYVLVAGAPPSAVRAATMFSILAIGFALQKHPNGINQLFAAAFILLCANPFWIYDVGFQLSFTAVLSILIFYRPVYKLISPPNKLLRNTWSAVSISIAAEILIAPLVIYYFHLFPLQFIIANLLAYLCMGIILITGMLLIVFSFSETISGIVAVVIMQLADWFHWLVYGLQKLNPESFHSLTLSKWQLVLVYLLITTITVYYFNKTKRALITALLSLCLLLSTMVYNEWKTLHQQVLVLYNIKGSNYIELIEGKSYSVVVSPKKLPPNTEHFVLKPAHTVWHLRKRDTSASNHNFYKIGDKTALILNDRYADNQFHADYVIINTYIDETALNKIQKKYTPRQIIVGNNMQRKKAESLVRTGRQAGMNIHYTVTDGAFVLKTD